MVHVVEIPKELCLKAGGKWDDRLSEDNCTMPGETIGLHKVQYNEEFNYKTRLGVPMESYKQTAIKFFAFDSDADRYAMRVLLPMLMDRRKMGESVEVRNPIDDELEDYWGWKRGELEPGEDEIEHNPW